LSAKNTENRAGVTNEPITAPLSAGKWDVARLDGIWILELV
jgi:hypothetical protein